MSKIVELTDEKNYLRNILEAADENCTSAETVIQDRIEQIYEELERREKTMGALRIEIEIEDEIIYLYTENGTGAKYPCASAEEAGKALTKYLLNYAE